MTDPTLQYYHQPLRKSFPDLNSEQRLMVRSLLVEIFFRQLHVDFTDKLQHLPDNDFEIAHSDRIYRFIHSTALSDPILEKCFQLAEQKNLNSIYNILKYKCKEFINEEIELEAEPLTVDTQDQWDKVRKAYVDLAVKAQQTFPELAETLVMDLMAYRKPYYSEIRKPPRHEMH